MINNSLLVPKRSIFNVLGAICQKPSLISGEGIDLTDKDFEEPFYKITFAAINNIILGNPVISHISPIDIDNYIAENSKVYQVFEQNDGFEFISSAIQNANVELFEQNYKWIKKYTLLRDFNRNGFDITDLYDPQHFDMKVQQKQIKALEKMELNHIIEHITLKMIKI